MQKSILHSSIAHCHWELEVGCVMEMQCSKLTLKDIVNPGYLPTVKKSVQPHSNGRVGIRTEHEITGLVERQIFDSKTDC